ncbi:Phosphatidylserine/phosphatidylglycerophosphate/cardiolipin synthase [Micromonospora sediminicola]|uniref:Phosphatidylserine/phosphatidylglycerophosphate/cardiolipin synthase n=1 Tax=Micromonospora sediminicola TaxID=946078 RepID=A0A1A9BDG3_9ACTN|nr:MULTISPECIES: phospholipase D-like domain-containing protein [Micromonospora]PGH45626.1 phospholipase [Micromonospora sp. WMMA1996]SBT67545.1 Phosphatidylserine/phosphatidylglycerophosphate/cardiolipin synthase [Micromonospora sediminicola]
MTLRDWFLTAQERANPGSELPVWTSGNLAEPLIHGAAYFDRLVREVEALTAGDHLFFTDWRGDPDERMRPDGPTVVQLFAQAAQRGVVVKGLLWRSHLDALSYSEEENRDLSEAVCAAGGEVLLDQRVRRGGSHHQKLVVLRHPDDPGRDIAFAGGIDLCHSRRDDATHAGDPQPVAMSPRYGTTPPWHDVQLALRGPVVGALDTTFRERWTDPMPLDSENPMAYLRDRLRGSDLRPDPLPDQPADPPPCGPHHVQVLRTYPAVRPRYSFAPDGERTVARGYTKAVRRARRLIYLEDQYLWSNEVAELFAQALREHPDLHLVAVVPRHPDVDGRLALPPNMVGREQALSLCHRAAPDRVHVFDVENHEGTPVYVHAKVCVVDDVWASVGSDNFNRRSWTHDSELSCAVLDDTHDERSPADPAGLGDGARVFARDLRLRLWREHLDRDPDGAQDDDLLDPAEAVAAITAAAEELDRWHAGGRVGPRPPGRLRPHRPERLPWRTRLWALPAYRLVYDPDGRPLRARRAGTW